MSSYTIIGTPWQQLFDYPTGNDNERVRLYQGPANDLDAQVATIKATLNWSAIDPSVSPGSAIASIRVTYDSPGDPLAPDERRHPLFELQTAMQVVDIKAHHFFKPVGSDMVKIDELILTAPDKIATIYAGNDLAIKYARIRFAGVDTWQYPGQILTVTRFYRSPPDLSADYTKINEVVTWANVKTHGKAISNRITEPKWVHPDGTSHSYEWRLLDISPSYQRSQPNVVRWTFEGLEYFAKWLHKGGTWEPASL